MEIFQILNKILNILNYCRLNLDTMGLQNIFIKHFEDIKKQSYLCVH